MTELTIIIESWTLIAVICFIYGRNIIRRTYDLLSWRNLMLGGFIHFYLLGAYFTASGQALPEFGGISSNSWYKLALMTPLFLFAFLGAASFAYKREWFSKVIPKIELPVTAPAVVMSSIILMILAIIFSFPFFNYFGVIVAQVRGQIAATAIGLATYYLIVRRFNPASWTLFLCSLSIGLISSTVGTTGRRLLLSVLLVVPWMWYFGSWRYRGAASNFVRVMIWLVFGILAIIIYSPFRSTDYQHEATTSTVGKRTDQFLEIITDPKIDPDVIKYILYTDTVPNTLFILENYPESFSFMPFHGLYWFIANPIPRELWPSKPEAMGGILRDQMHVAPNLGVGIIGHGWSELSAFGVLYYALFFGLLVGGVDRAIAQRAWNPFFLSVMGSGMGNVVALTRGDTPLFMIQITGGIVFSALILYILKAAAPVWASFPSLVPAGMLAPAPPPEEDAYGELPEEPGNTLMMPE